MLSHGAIFTGIAMVAMVSQGADVPVICCCKLYNFSDCVMLDSILAAERGKEGQELRLMRFI